MAGISLRGLNRMAEMARQSRNVTAAGLNVDSSVGNPITTPVVQDNVYCFARITGIAYSSGTTPLLDDNGYIQYTWVESERYIDSNGFPAWEDVTLQPRGSQMIGTGKYLNLAHEANGGGGVAVGTIVLAWAGICNMGTNGPDSEYVFWSPSTAWGTTLGTATISGSSGSAIMAPTGGGTGQGITVAGSSPIFTIQQAGNYFFDIYGYATPGGSGNLVVGGLELLLLQNSNPSIGNYAVLASTGSPGGTACSGILAAAIGDTFDLEFIATNSLGLGITCGGGMSAFLLGGPE